MKKVKETLAKEHYLPENLNPQKILAAELAKTMQIPANGFKYDWKQVIEWMENDSRMLAAEVLPGRIDAFEMEEESAAKEEKQKAENKSENHVDRHEPTPRELEMELSGTLLGRGGGAIINGKAYRLGRAVTSEKDQHKTSFTLSEIHDRHVVLTRKGKKYQLLLPEKISGSISIKTNKDQ